MRPDIFLATIGRGSNGSNALEVTEDRAAVTAESQDNIINRVNNVSQYGPSWHYVPGIGVAGTAYAEVPNRSLGDLAFSRASSKTRTNAAGVVETIAANVPPHDYRNADGTLSTFPRLNLEPQRTNLVTYSEQIDNSNYTKVAMNVSSNATIGPDGYLGADKIISTSANSSHSIYQTIGTVGNSAAISCFVKKAEYRYVNIQYGTAITRFDFDTLTFSGGTNNAYVHYGNGWYRISTVLTAAVNARVTIAIPDNSGNVSYVGDNVSGTFVWGLQAESAASYPTTYIPTTTAAVTRLRDFCLKGNIGNTSTAGTLFTEFDVTRITSNNGQYLIGMAVGTVDTLGGAYSTVSNSISIIANGPILQGRNNGLSTTLFSLTPSVGNNVKIIMRYNGTNVVAFVNGVKQTIYTDTSVGVKNFIRINNGEESTYNARQLAFFSSELTDAQCIQLTTL